MIVEPLHASVHTGMPKPKMAAIARTEATVWIATAGLHLSFHALLGHLVDALPQCLHSLGRWPRRDGHAQVYVRAKARSEEPKIPLLPQQLLEVLGRLQLVE